MISYGANLGLMVNAATGEVHDVALRGFLRGVDGLVQPNVKGYLTNTPPGGPTDGDVYIIGAAPTGAWAGNAGKVTRWYANDGTWDFYTPKNGWMLQSNSSREMYRYTGGSWEIYYQEGTWTALLAGDVTPGSNTYDRTGGNYTKIGNLSRVSAWIQMTAKDVAMAGDVRIIGLPFSASTTTSISGFTFGRYGGIAAIAGKPQLAGYFSGTTIVLSWLGGGFTYSFVPTSGLTPTVEIFGSGVYQIA